MFETMGESSTRGGEKRGWGIDAGGFCMPRYPDLKLDQRLHKTAMPFISRNRNVRCRATRGSKGWYVRRQTLTFMFPRRLVLSTTSNFLMRSLFAGRRQKKKKMHLDTDPSKDGMSTAVKSAHHATHGDTGSIFLLPQHFPAVVSSLILVCT